ncbi:glutaredoxin 2 [Francisella tularensis]|uniref:glutaredoxin 2 n=1 Tax=Francisella tularensis TaxID=263 RepID=UPI000173E450|nr:glutaredoxin 2 [Francisella tularensis]ACD31083.1 glutaredoxin 2 [Francisella tularensis subsp. mediasiatica FSC147]MBK2078679.1 glutaredoxin 2 [Francisella tularensis subsp. mediasiatica]MBK2101171.1 glutaredoxin 2 [Francisella tularensis subsp. mediasiatica]MBK2104807.1 glutaredoxin 2 [Francisella tularensis subsp. mediasiatica]MDN9003926.1 glutaredoxin 2 [Francisella tularensis subsp. mediasiatica]
MKIYIYHHCPYCIKVRLVADLSNFDYQMIILANDDEKAHIDRIGSKQVPFLEKDDGTFIKESDEICKFIAKVQNFEIAESTIDDFVKGCIADLEPHYRRIIYPRIPHHPRNECDFPTQSAKEYFINKKSQYIGDFDALLRNPPYDSIKAINQILAKIDPFIKTPFINGEKFSWDDINIFPIFFILTMSKDLLEIPTNITNYIKNIEAKTNIELY